MGLTSLYDFYGSWHLYICRPLFGRSSGCVIGRNFKWNLNPNTQQIPLKISPYNTTRSALQKHEWRDKKKSSHRDLLKKKVISSNNSDQFKANNAIKLEKKRYNSTFQKRLKIGS